VVNNWWEELIFIIRGEVYKEYRILKDKINFFNGIKIEKRESINI